MQLKWIVRETDEQKVANLQAALGINEVLCRLLVQRGVETYEDAFKFFRPSLDHLHDPFLMRDMDKAVERIDRAISSGEKILIYGDYDVDGTTAVALVYLYLKDFYPSIDFYIPHRYTEGYGISTTGIDWAADHGFSLIIALDCGIKSVAEIEYAASKGIDFIICDHHLPGEIIPNAVAVLDPKRSDCEYPYKELSGCGLGFKLMDALGSHFDIPRQRLTDLISLTAISIACDIVPITGENRVLTHFGLKQIHDNPLPGLKALIEVSGLQKDLDISDLVFYIGPRINAAGRIDDAKKAVRLLIAEEEAPSKEHADVLQSQNTTRKSIDSQITEEALGILKRDPEFYSKKATVIFNEGWHKGVIGIVASRLIETYYKPTIVFTSSGGDLVTGSARSVAGFNIYDAIFECKELLEKFGGHKYAAGLSLKRENFEIFKEKFENLVAATIDDDCLTRKVHIDAPLNLKDIQGNFVKILKQFAPFGPYNMKPVFMTKDVSDTGYGKIVGENHLKLRLRNGQVAPSFNAIAFEKGDYFEKINGKSFKVCYTIEENTFRGETTLQLNVKDLLL